MGQIAYAFRLEMSRALYATYREILLSGECVTQHEAIDRARKSPAPHFFTSAKNCAYIVTRMQRGEPTGLRNPDKVRKFNELARLVEEYMSEHGEEATKGILSVCEEVVNMPAPEYYICHNTAKQIILRERKRSREEAMRWVRR